MCREAQESWIRFPLSLLLNTKLYYTELSKEHLLRKEQLLESREIPGAYKGLRNFYILSNQSRENLLNTPGLQRRLQKGYTLRVGLIPRCKATEEPSLTDENKPWQDHVDL